MSIRNQITEEGYRAWSTEWRETYGVPTSGMPSRRMSADVMQAPLGGAIGKEGDAEFVFCVEVQPQGSWRELRVEKVDCLDSGLARTASTLCLSRLIAEAEKIRASKELGALVEAARCPRCGGNTSIPLRPRLRGVMRVQCLSKEACGLRADPVKIDPQATGREKYDAAHRAIAQWNAGAERLLAAGVFQEAIQ